MDLKGISWVGNIYQKFEAMCLEVEEIMYEDTVKYVENQVQTVGSNVKKFYSDVMLDLLPPSSVDAAKLAVSDVPYDFYSDVGIYMKPKAGVKEKFGMVDDRVMSTEDPKISNKNLDNTPTFHGLCHVENIFPLSGGDYAGGASRQHGKRSLSNKLTVVRKNSNRDNRSPDKKSGAINFSDEGLTSSSSFCQPSNENLGDYARGAPELHDDGCVSVATGRRTNENSEGKDISPTQGSNISVPLFKDSTRVSSVCELSNESNKEFVGQKAEVTTLGSVEVTGHDSSAERQNESENVIEQIPHIQKDGASPDMVDSFEFGPSQGIHMTPSSFGSSSAEATEKCSSDGVNFLQESCAKKEVQSNEIAEDHFVSNSERSDNFSTDVNKVGFSSEHGTESVEQVDKAKLEESCILVSADECHFVLQSKGKNKSYKKKIQHVFSPKKRPTRIQEYEKLAIWTGSDSNFNDKESAKNSVASINMKDDAKTSSSAPDSCDSEWELL
ncbi:uncharacterized protein LOC126655421 isoform X2 [Mercurialis annua]|uniref:uncharacterized protein LOC126655421 isoform X2 n=1 Tax=Mercurialis annua TaxID=3986 RepID=UPI00215E0B2C|nr:uncharacterized protein LOC126655421 isoform X2 [Mercurialis annua]